MATGYYIVEKPSVFNVTNISDVVTLLDLGNNEFKVIELRSGASIENFTSKDVEFVDNNIKIKGLLLRELSEDELNGYYIDQSNVSFFQAGSIIILDDNCKIERGHHIKINGKKIFKIKSIIEYDVPRQGHYIELNNKNSIVTLISIKDMINNQKLIV